MCSKEKVQLLGIQMYWHELNFMVVAFCKNKYSTGAKQIIDFILLSRSILFQDFNFVAINWIENMVVSV